MDDEEGKKQRSLKNLRMTRRYRIMYLGIWMLVMVALIGMLDFSIYLNYTQLWDTPLPVGADTLTVLAYQESFAIISLLALSLILLGGLAVLSMFSGHRIGGPYIAMKRTMAQVRDGNFDSRLSFRTYDKLDDIEIAFNEMMDVVQANIQRQPEEASGEVSAPVQTPSSLELVS